MFKNVAKFCKCLIKAYNLPNGKMYNIVILRVFEWLGLFFTVTSGLYDVCVGGGMFSVLFPPCFFFPMEPLGNMKILELVSGESPSLPYIIKDIW